MQVIKFLRGLPASGKSTFAKQLIKDNPDFVRINKDDIREMFNGIGYSREFENFVLDIQRNIGLTALNFKKSLVVDDTNFAHIHLDYWSKVAKNLNIKIEILDFDTPVEECIRRDSEREKSVGKDVIMGMYNKYLKSKN